MYEGEKLENLKDVFQPSCELWLLAISRKHISFSNFAKQLKDPNSDVYKVSSAALYKTAKY